MLWTHCWVSTLQRGKERRKASTLQLLAVSCYLVTGSQHFRYALWFIILISTLILLPTCNTQLVRASMTCQDFWKAYFDIQGRMKEIRAKNIDSRRKRRALFTQLRATKGLEILSLVNVQHPCTGKALCPWNSYRREVAVQKNAGTGLVEVAWLMKCMRMCVCNITENLFSQVSTMTSLRELNLSGSNLTGKANH